MVYDFTYLVYSHKSINGFINNNYSIIIMSAIKKFKFMLLANDD